MEQESKEILFAKDKDKELAPASNENNVLAAYF